METCDCDVYGRSSWDISLLLLPICHLFYPHLLGVGEVSRMWYGGCNVMARWWAKYVMIHHTKFEWW